MNTKKKHHFVPQTYLRSFTDDNDNKLVVFRKDDPKTSFRRSVNNEAFHKYYYSIPEGDGRNHNIIEDLFSDIEAAWPEILRRIYNKEPLGELTDKFCNFVCLQRIRVPAFRDGVEAFYAENIKGSAKILHNMGKLQPLPKEYPNILEDMVVAIDPYMSLKIMGDTIKGVGHVIGYVRLSVLRNATSTPFVTSDNPVIYFDPTSPFEEVKPYVLCKERMNVLFLMPLTPDLILVGISGIPVKKWGDFLKYDTQEITDSEIVNTFNTEICRFAYGAVYSKNCLIQDTVKKYSHISPVIKVVKVPHMNGYALVSQMSFGKRHKKRKWQKQPS